MTTIGECPYEDCDNIHAYDADLFVYTKHKCGGCNRLFWICHHPFEPFAMTDADFNEIYIVKGNKIEKREES